MPEPEIVKWLTRFQIPFKLLAYQSDERVHHWSFVAIVFLHVLLAINILISSGLVIRPVITGIVT